jgi:hypothetical protein
MSILDDAIREHLELKRAHGADATELKKLEDEAFGPPARPDDLDPLAEAPTEFLGTPEAAEAELDGDGAPSVRRVPNIADLQEAPEPAEAEQPESQGEEPRPQEPEPEPPAEEEHPAMEHEAVPDPQPQLDAGHSTEERHAIAEQPTELFDVEAAELGSEAAGPSDEELVDAEITEPRLAPVDPLAGVDAAVEPEIAEGAAAEEEEEDDFFSEQRLSDELSQALDAPVTDEHEVAEAGEHAALGTDEHAVPHTDEHEAQVEDEEDGEYDEDEYEDDDEEEPAAEAEPGRDDVLEDTPDFLEDAPEDDNLWFEQRPPKDFDFDD